MAPPSYNELTRRYRHPPTTLMELTLLLKSVRSATLSSWITRGSPMRSPRSYKMMASGKDTNFRYNMSLKISTLFCYFSLNKMNLFRWLGTPWGSGDLTAIESPNACHMSEGSYYSNPRRNNNVFTTPTPLRRRRVDVVKTLYLRHYCVMCPLGTIKPVSWRVHNVLCNLCQRQDCSISIANAMEIL